MCPFGQSIPISRLVSYCLQSLGQLSVRFEHYVDPDVSFLLSNLHVGLGLDLAKTIPRDREKYLKWLEEKRRELDVLIEETTSSEEYIYDEDNETSTGLSKKRPLPDIMIEWTYIIDLDHEIFHGMWISVCLW